MNKESFIFYRSFATALKKIPDQARLSLYDAITGYCFDGIEPELSGIAEIAWDLIKPQLDANKKRQDNGKYGGLGAGYGKLGGRPKDDNPHGGIELTPMGDASKTPMGDTNKPPNDNDNDNINDNEKETGEPSGSPPSETAIELAELILTEHRKEFPDYLSGKKDRETVERWAIDIDRLIRIDKKAPENIRQVILWAKTPGNFWFHNIESGAKLRKQYERLSGQMASEKKPTGYAGPPKGLEGKESLSGLASIFNEGG